MSYSLKFKRGDKVRSLRDGVTGVVVGYVEPIGAIRAWVIDVPMKEDKASFVGELTTIMVDESELVFVEAGDPEYRWEFPTNFRYEVGTLVEHKFIKEIKGMIMSRRCFANGCFHYRVTLPTLEEKKQKPIDGFYPETLLRGNNVFVSGLYDETHDTNEATAPGTGEKSASAEATAATQKKGGPRERVVSRANVW